jgi:hypothetical protein
VAGHALSNETGVYSGYRYANTKAVKVIEQFKLDNQAKMDRGEQAATGLFLYLAWHNTHTPYTRMPRRVDVPSVLQQLVQTPDVVQLYGADS